MGDKQDLFRRRNWVILYLVIFAVLFFTDPFERSPEVPQMWDTSILAGCYALVALTPTMIVCLISGFITRPTVQAALSRGKLATEYLSFLVLLTLGILLVCGTNPLGAFYFGLLLAPAATFSHRFLASRWD